MMTKFGGCWISQHTCKQRREEEEGCEDHETSKYKNMKIMQCQEIKNEHHKGEEA